MKKNSNYKIKRMFSKVLAVILTVCFFTNYVLASAGEIKTEVVTKSIDHFDSTYQYISGDKSGVLSKDGQSIPKVLSGSFTPSDSIQITNFEVDAGTNQPLSTWEYNLGVYTGTINLVKTTSELGWIKDSTTKFFRETKENIKTTNYNASGTVTSTTYTWGDTDIHPTLHIKKSVDGFDFEGDLKQISGKKISETGIIKNNDGTSYEEITYEGVYEGTLTGYKPPVQVICYKGLYSGTVSKPAVDTRVWEYKQNYIGLVYSTELKQQNYANPTNGECVGEPVNIVTGNFYSTDHDISIPDKGTNLEIMRYYNSLDTRTSSIGKAWRFTYDSSLITDTASGNAKIIYPDGHTVIFTPVAGTNKFSAPEPIFDTLEKNGDGTSTLKLQNKLKYNYSATGKLISIVDTNGNTVTLQYDGSGSLSTVTGAGGKTLTFTFQNGKVKTITDPIGRTIEYSYDTSNNLASVKGIGGGNTSYEYTAGGVKSVTDRNGKKFVENEYDEYGRVTQQYDEERNITKYTYDEKNLENTCTFVKTGDVTRYKYNQNLYIAKKTYSDGTTEEYAYDSWGNRNSVKDRNGNTTTYTFDIKGNKLTEKAPASLNDTVTYNYNYDNNDNITQISTSGGSVTSFEYDSRSNRVKSTVKLDASTNTITSYGYDEYGRVTNIKDGENNPITFEYATDRSPVKVTDPEGNIVEFTYDGVGRKTTIKNSYGTTTYEYNADDKIVKVVDPAGNSTRLKYDAMGNLVKQIKPEQYNNTTDDGTGYTFSYDAMDRMISQTDSLGNTAGLKYDQLGRKIKEINPNYYDAATGDGKGIGYEYNTDGRLISIVNPSGQKSRIVYDPAGNRVRFIDANNYDENSNSGAGLQYSYDQMNRPIQVMDTYGTVVKRLVYDADSRIVKEIDAKGYQSGSTDSTRYGTVYSYNLAGWLMEKRVPQKIENGIVYYQITRYERDLTGNVLKQKTSQQYVTISNEPSAWNTVTYTYYKNGKVKSVTDSLGAVIEYAYDGAGNTINEQSKINAGKNSIVGYHYNSAGLIDRMWKELDGEDLKNDTTGKLNAETLFEYDKNGSITKVTRPEGYVTTFEYDVAGRLAAKHEEVQADQLELIHTTASIELPNANAYPGMQYDCKIEIQPDAEVKGIDMEIEYDARAYEFAGLTPGMSGILIDGGATGKARIRATSISINKATTLATLKLKSKEGVFGAGYITISPTSTYTDAGGKVSRFAELNGKSVIFKGPDINGDGKVEGNDLTLVAAKIGMTKNTAGYDSKYDVNADDVINNKDLDFIKDYLFSDVQITNLSKVKYLEKSYSGACKVNSATLIRTTSYQYDKAGNLVKETDCNGKSVDYAYDVSNRLISVTDKKGAKSRVFYDEVGNKVKDVTPENYNPQTDDGAGNTYKYDTMNRLVEIRDAQGIVTQKRVYDSAGLLSKLIDAVGYQSAGTDSSRYGIEYTYDLGNRVTAITSPEAKLKNKVSESYTFDSQGFVLTNTNGNQHTTTYERDMWGKILKVTDAKSVNTVYTYDFAGNLTTTTDGNTNTTTFIYNSLNKLASITDPAGKKTSYKYDKESRLAQENDRNGQTITFTYNSDNNLSLKDIAGKTEQERYMYSTDGSMIGAANAWGVDEFKYDDNKLLKKRTRNGKPYIEYDYNKNREVTKVTDGSGAVTGYTYDTDGRVRTVLDGTSLLATYNYNADNTLSTINYNNGVNTSYTYDKDKNLSGILQKNTQGGMINNFSYTYDLNSNQLTKTENSATTAYTYDELDRLKTVNYAGRGLETYTYDNAGNRLSKVLGTDNTTYAYDSRNRLTQSVNNGTTTSYSYDNNGNLLKSKKGSSVTMYSYDGYNRLQEAIMPDGNWTSNEYDAFGLRVAEIENGTRNDFTLDGQNVIAEKSGESAEVRYIRGISLVAMKGNTGDLSYYLHNAHGDVVNLIGSTGNVLNSYSYDAFGNTLTSTETVANRFMYAGEQFDKVTGEYYLRARYYDPVVGRFTQEDTYRGDGLNLYAYVANNPVNFLDPSGHCKTSNGTEITIENEAVPGGATVPDIWSVSGSFFLGIGDAAVANAKDIWEMITNPIETVKLFYVMSKPMTPEYLQMQFIMSLMLTKTWNDFSVGNADIKARMIGRLVGEILIGVIVSKGTAMALEALKASAQTGRLAQLLRKIGRGESTAIDVAKVIEGGSDMLQTLSRQSIDDKLTRYLLNADHPVGGSKAKWFKEALGYTQSNMDDLAKQIVFDPTKAVQTGVTEYGTKFNQVISITGANGKVIDVTFAWMKSAEDDVVRLVTSIPTKK